MSDSDDELRAASTIELVDWPHQSVPAALDRAGFLVVGHEPDSIKRYRVEDAEASGDGCRSFPLDDGGFLVSRDIPGLPESIDVVCTYRPADEQPAIARDAIANGAKLLWIEPGESSSDEARDLALQSGVAFVDGESIAAAVERLGIRRPG